jgi:hypothetical protein
VTLKLVVYRHRIKDAGARAARKQRATDALEAALLEHNLRVTQSSAKQAHQSRPDTPKDRTSSGRKATPAISSSEAEVPWRHQARRLVHHASARL